MKRTINECYWYEDGEDTDLWVSECGLVWQLSDPLDDDEPMSDEFQFCPKCGNRISTEHHEAIFSAKRRMGFPQSDAQDMYVSLRAIVARIKGDFDDPDLIACGPLNPDALSDVLDCAVSTLSVVDGQQGGFIDD